MTLRPPHETAKPPLPLDTEVPPYGKVAAVGTINGERYYWFVKDWPTGGCSVAMVPHNSVEDLE